MSTIISYPPPLGTGVPAPAANVPEINPAPPTFNSAAGESSTQVYLSSTLPESAQQGQPQVNAPVSIGNISAASLQTFKWE
jgi:hypothetical protein